METEYPWLRAQRAASWCEAVAQTAKSAPELDTQRVFGLECSRLAPVREHSPELGL